MFKAHIQIIALLDLPSSSLTLSPRIHLIPEAACYVIQNTLSSLDATELQNSGESTWKKILDQNLRHRNETVQIAAASAMRVLSQQKNCVDDVKR